MQKKLLAAAVAGALAVPAIAQAQTSVQIYGAFDMSLHQYRVSSATAGTASLSKWDVYNQSSRLGFKGTEGMGGGMKAWFQIESNVAGDGRQNLPGGVNLATRNTGVGLTGGWGSVMLGAWDTPYKMTANVWDNASVGGLAGHRGPILMGGDSSGSNPNPNCASLAGGATLVATAICTQIEGSATSFHRRASNSVQYWSPVFGGGFDVKFAFTANEEKSSAGAFGNSNPSLWSLSAAYNSSVWRAFLGYERHQGFRDAAGAGLAGATLPTDVKDNGLILGGGYNFGVVDLSVAYEQLRYGNSGAAGAENGFKRAGWFVGLAVPIGSAGSVIRAGFSRTGGNKNCDVAAVCADTGARAITLGYDHALSKRSSVYIAYGQVRNDAAAAFTFNVAPTGPTGASGAIGAGADTTTLGVGIKHSF